MKTNFLYILIILAFLAGCSSGPVKPIDTDYLTEAVPAGFQQHTFFKTEGLGTFCAVPGENSIVFSSKHNSSNYNLYLKNLNDDKLTLLTNEPGDETFPAVSPSGKVLAFCSNNEERWSLNVMNLASGMNTPLSLISNVESELISPAWSPDGKKMVFSRFSAELEDYEICILDIEAAGSRNPKAALHFTGCIGLFPKWSPKDENIIAFQKANQIGENWFGLYIYDIMRERTIELVSDPRWAAINPSWSDDGKFIAFSAVNKSGSSNNIWAYEIDNSKLYQLTTGSESNYQPVWRKDRVLFCRTINGVTNIWSLKPEF
ncbi:MAG: PD40 domain-containing protein [Planctomycetes bacterium]|nr:PD40 domain-containing protein [Planctomycetota bacterium]